MVVSIPFFYLPFLRSPIHIKFFTLNKKNIQKSSESDVMLEIFLVIPVFSPLKKSLNKGDKSDWNICYMYIKIFTWIKYERK